MFFFKARVDFLITPCCYCIEPLASKVNKHRLTQRTRVVVSYSSTITKQESLIAPTLCYRVQSLKTMFMQCSRLQSKHQQLKAGTVLLLCSYSRQLQQQVSTTKVEQLQQSIIVKFQGSLSLDQPHCTTLKCLALLLYTADDGGGDGGGVLAASALAAAAGLNYTPLYI